MPPECYGLLALPVVVQQLGHFTHFERVTCVVSNRRMTEDRASFEDLISLGYLLSPWGYSTTQMVVFEICPGALMTPGRTPCTCRTFQNKDFPR
jgi:hypothetical protein